MSTLSQRVLNRTVLERQLLARRSDITALAAVEHLVALQGQEPNWPYIGLWTRLAGFRHHDLTTLLHSRGVVRAASLRTTQHLVSSRDFRWLRPLVQPILDRAPRQGFGRDLTGLDLGDLADAGREILAGDQLTRTELGRLLAARYPGRNGGSLAWTVQFLVPLIHPPPNGTWGSWGNRGATPVVLAEEWIGAPMLRRPRVEALVRRYLAAFGPASIMDVQAWSGLTRLREVVDRLRPRLRVYHDEHGKELFDLPDAALADPDLPVPVRFLPAFDNLVVGHADRSRVISDDDRRRVVSGSDVRPTFLVDGFVRGTWSMKEATVRISPFRPLSGAAIEALHAEAERLIEFVARDVAKDAAEWDIAIV